ncbi:MAG: hypothetical protein GX879_01860 [Bacteroidales bacterium]|nr:hypothetical protein [Bacteroidales bacterium]
MRKIVLISLFLVIGKLLLAQSLPADWSFEILENSDKQFVLSAKLKINGDWYVYAENMPDGGPLPMLIHFDEQTQEISGEKLKSATQAKVLYDDIFEMNVNIYEDTAIFVRKFEPENKKFESLLYVEVQACNKKDGQCVLINDEFLIKFENQNNLWQFEYVKSK